jgi:cytochrome oxidase Cu insertion factor (SCO1/SenC/PrrC family)
MKLEGRSREFKAVKTTGRSRLIVAALAGLALVAACSSAMPAASSSSAATSASEAPSLLIETNNPNPTMPSWFAVPMTDVNSGQQFKIQDFAGHVVLVDTMATWCPTCQGEMSQVQQVLDALGPPKGDLVAVSLDVDPNEDAALLKKYTTTNHFGWRVAIAPTEVGHFLAGNYDPDYLNPPLQPMLIIDRKGQVWGLPFGVKSYISLEKTIQPYMATP